MAKNIYPEKNFKKIKMVLDSMGYNFFQGKTLLDLGAYEGEIGSSFFRLGSTVTCIDARNEFVKLIGKKYPGIKTICADLDKEEWTFGKFDVILSLDLICYLKNYKEHLRNICTNGTYLIIETAIADSNDPNFCQTFVANKSEDQSFNGFSSRPSGAMIEQILTQYNFEFKRYDYSKLNLDKQIYDWQVKNTNNSDINKRRFWVAKKRVDAAIKTTPAAPQQLKIFTPSITLKAPLNSIQNSCYKRYIPAKDSLFAEIDNVKLMSKDCALIYAEDFETLNKSSITGTIFPVTYNSKLWFKKIIPYFPNVKLHSLAKTMFGFQKSSQDIDLAICSIYNLIPCKKILLEEYDPSIELNEEIINILKQCSLILTPSLFNFQQIEKLIPNISIKRINKYWPSLNKAQNKENFHLYFEKNSNVTKNLLEAWDSKWGKLKIVNASFKLPEFADFVSDCEDFSNIYNLFEKSKSLIDISESTYYSSGKIHLAKGMGLPIITNNQFMLHEGNHNLISSSALIPTSQEINVALNKADFSQVNRDDSYQQKFINSIESLLC